jgi:outer membrane cobalamin receptor
MKQRILLTLGALLLCATWAFAQTGSIEGTVVDGESGEAVPGANVVVKGTVIGSITNEQGKFSVNNVPTGDITLMISFIGYATHELPLTIAEGSTTNAGEISIQTESVGLSEVMVIASVAIDRKTPVAVSTVKFAQIEEKASNLEFPELLKSTPGVYTTKSGGGYGDSRVNIRGFSSVNVAVLINGIPVNDMENGIVYWSNWAGLTDVTSSMQVQRGLGASRVAVPSIGGTINVLTRTTDATRGGSFFVGTGNNGYRKASFALSTGLGENGWAVSLSGARIEGDGYVDGTQFLGYNYFFNVTKKINESHILSLTGTGAPQRHGQRQNRLTIPQYRDAPHDIRHNPDWGYRDGQVVQIEDNFYHKPLFSLNHYWTINDKSELSTAAYASYGTGGGGGTGGNFGPANRGYLPKDIDALVTINQNSSDGNALAWQRASRNDHNWYGILSTYTNQITENINLLAGLDLRTYTGKHFTEMTDLLGADYLLDNSDINNPNRLVKVGDKYSYNNDGVVNWTGGFVQAEYTRDKLSAFVNLSASNTSYKRIDYFLYLDNDPLQESDKYNFFGYQAKGGVNYNMNLNHNVFANVGYFEKAPGFDAVFPRFNNTDVNETADNQKITSFEVGYGYRGTKLSANVNLYSTLWADRTFSRSFTAGDGSLLYANILGVDALHQGIEADFSYQPNDRFSLSGMISVGDWRWKNDVDQVQILDENQVVVGTINKLYIADLKVGDAAQTTLALGGSYEILDGLKVGLSYNYFANLFANYDPTTRTSSEDAGVQPLELPDYGTVDANMKFDFNIGSLDASLIGNVNNLFDEEYIAEAQDGTIDKALVYYGFGRTWTLGLKVKF